MIKEATPYRQRIKTLDSLRGIAAVIVVFTHTTSLRTDGNEIHYTPFYIFRSAHEAVLFFFLLSGYVLVHQYRNNPAYTYGHFLILRFFRIYVPYILAVFLAMVLSLLCIPKHEGIEWISGLWSTPLTIAIVAKHIIAVRSFNTGIFDPVIWSLIHEMRMALLFPLLLYIVNLKPLKTIFILALLVVLSVISIIFNFTNALGFNDSYGYTAYYFYMFALGGIIARYQPYLVNWQKTLSANARVLFLIAALFCYNYSSLLENIVSVKSGYNMVITTVEDLIAVIASSYFIIAAISVVENNILCSKVPLFLGKISYSLYLVHVPVLGFVYFTLYGKIQTGIIMCIGLLMSFLVAIIFNKYVEQQTMKFAKRVLLTMVPKTA